ncbi:hypothetical protein [Mesorhizobium sp. M1D.F.Ca.ET.043.01.1.1]
MAKGIKIGDEVAITATVRRRVTEDRVNVSLPAMASRIRSSTEHQK